MRNRIATLTAACLLTLSGHATHIIGGEIFYDYLGNNQYRITLKLYRDCAGIAFDPSASVGVFNASNNSLYSSHSIPFPGEQNVPIFVDDPCLTLPPNICIRTVSYVTTITLPPNADGYIVAHQRCCRTSIVSNLQNPGNVGVTCMTRIPGQADLPNSSARFNLLPPVALCLNAPLVFDHSATDPDGDSLVYELCTPWNGGTMAQPAPAPPLAPPYLPIPWGAGYTATNPIPSSPPIAIDPATGVLTVRPTQLGNYVIGVCVSEYRNGILLSTTTRDFMFAVVACDAVVTAVIPPQTQFCTGLTANFGNNSSGGSIWAWDFGDPNTTADTSRLRTPSWTYAQPGTYTVRLIANPGTTCADTAEAIFRMYLNPEPFFDPPAPVCGPLSTTLVVQGDHFGPGATVDWNFGAGATPSSGTGPSVNVTFPPAVPGSRPVTVTVTENGCTGTFTANVEANPDPVAAIAPQSQFCTGLTTTFGNNSTGGQRYFWDFGDPGTSADTSNLQNPTWTYAQPGTYTVRLIVWSTAACVDTTEAEFRVYLNPVPYFDPDTACGSLQRNLIVQGLNFGPGATVTWTLSGGAIPSAATGPQVAANFPAPGTYPVTVTVAENGCTGTYTANFIVYPSPTAYFVVDPASPRPIGTDITFTDQSTGSILTRTWTRNGEVVPNAGLVWTWTMPLPGTHTITLAVTSPNGCSDSYTITYVILPEDINIPNVFSPNGDGRNDRFIIRNIEYYGNRLTIYNRWGMPVFEANNYRNQWSAPDVPDGTYYYVLVLDDGRDFAGHVTLLR